MSLLDIKRVTGRPIRVAVVGAGAMGLAWLRAVERHPELELAGIVDIDIRQAKAGAIRIRRPDLPTATTLAELMVPADACVNVTPPKAHHSVILAALEAGLPVLTEKPFAASMREATELSALATARRQLLMVAQTRHYEQGLTRLRALASTCGQLCLVSTEFRRGYKPAGFRLTMPNPLLLDMAVHAFDAARYIIGAQPTAVSAMEFNPSHSWFREGAAAVVAVEFRSGVHYAYSGSWCAEGAETSWSGRWRVDGELGACTWTGDSSPVCTLSAAEAETGGEHIADGAADPVSQVTAPLDDFVTALRTGTRPWGEASDNLWSFAMAQAAILSARRKEQVRIDDVLAVAGRA